MGSPVAGTNVKIKSYKHNGRLHRVWDENLILKGSSKGIIGANDRVNVIESNGSIWTTKEPAIFYFHTEYWFNVIGMLKDDGIHYYCNLSSPVLYEEQTLKYIDYDLDVRIFPDMTYLLLDEDEFEQNRHAMNYPNSLYNILFDQLEQLYHWIRQRKGPFAPGFVDQWYERYLTYI